MRLYDYPEKVAAWERKINAYAQQKGRIRRQRERCRREGG